MRTAVQDTSVSAFYGHVLNGKAKTQADRIFDVIEAHFNNSERVAPDASLNEIKQLYRAAYRKDIELSTVSARVNGLVAAKRLERLETIRKCAVTGAGIHPVRLPKGQMGLF